MRVLTFSTHFPKGHPKEGKQTFFREKIWAGLADRADGFKIPDEITDWDWYEYYNGIPKHHTIRSGNRWKVGDKFSPRIWSGKPYASKQITFAPPIEIKKIWEIKIEGYQVFINKELFSQFQYSNQVANLAKNDGLSVDDFWNWFPCKPGKVFEGQIISWSIDIAY